MKTLPFFSFILFASIFAWPGLFSLPCEKEAIDETVPPVAVSFETTQALNSAAIRFYTNDTIVDVGDEFCMDVRVDGFNRVLIMQYSLTWDSTRLEFVSVDDLTLPFNHIFATPDPPLIPANAITFSGDAEDPINGETLDDGTAIFRICFRVLKASRDCIKVSFGGDPVPMEFVNADFNNIGILDDMGDICIPPDGPDRYSTRDSKIYIKGQHDSGINNDEVTAPGNLKEEQSYKPLTAFPNPVHNTMFIQLEENMIIDQPVLISDMHGRPVASYSVDQILDGNRLELDLSGITETGVYYCQLKWADGQQEIIRFIKQ